jgi:hypothetical protein
MEFLLEYYVVRISSLAFLKYANRMITAGAILIAIGSLRKARFLGDSNVTNTKGIGEYRADSDRGTAGVHLPRAF